MDRSWSLVIRSARRLSAISQPPVQTTSLTWYSWPVRPEEQRFDMWNKAVLICGFQGHVCLAGKNDYPYTQAGEW
jgi:hypothetical protein